jgi:hypothetical protein
MLVSLAYDSDDIPSVERLSNPRNKLLIFQQPQMTALAGLSSTEGYYGSGMLSLWGGGSQQPGPYADPAARHQFLQSRFHRSVDFCGSCHDISNPVVGDLAPTTGPRPVHRRQFTTARSAGPSPARPLSATRRTPTAAHRLARHQ